MHQKAPLQALSDERAVLRHASRSGSEPVTGVARAKTVLAVATVAQALPSAVWWRASARGLEALVPGHGSVRQVRYTSAERQRILAEARRPPKYEQDGLATWSLVSSQWAHATCTPMTQPVNRRSTSRQHRISRGTSV